jgi:hypothetical protein
MMQYVCEAPPKTWFRIETQAEADLEARAMNHAVEKYFRRAHEEAAKTYAPPRSAPVFEHSIGLKAHIARVMPIFLTLRDGEGTALATAMLPPAGVDEKAFTPIIVGVENSDPYPSTARRSGRWAPTSSSSSIPTAAIPTAAADPAGCKRRSPYCAA